MSNLIKVSGVILAGGRATRMGNKDKGLMHYKGQPMVRYAITAMLPVVDQLIINANRNLDQYRQFNLPVVTDQTNDFDGPLAGILAAMLYTEATILIVVPCDLPLIQSKHLQKLLSTCLVQQADIAVAFDGTQMHPLLLAINTNLKTDLQDYLASGQRKVGSWIAQKKTVQTDFSEDIDTLVNINTISDLSALEAFNI